MKFHRFDKRVSTAACATGLAKRELQRRGDLIVIIPNMGVQNAMSLFVNHVGKRVMISMQIKCNYYLLNSQLFYLHTIHSSHKYCPEMNWGRIQIN